LEYGSPKIPLFPEALLLHHLDNMESKTESMRALIDRDKQVTGVWTSYSSPLDRAALKKSKYLDDSPAPAVETPPAKQNPPVVDPNSGFGAKLRDALGGKS
jgi:3'-5' exoribonuclease